MATSPREEVIETALRLVEREGEAGIGFNRVARALGVKPPWLYSHVADHEELCRLVTMRAWEQFADAAELARGRRRGRAAILMVAHTYREFAQAHPGLFRLMETIAIAPDDETFAASRERLFELFAGPLAELGASAGEFVHQVRALRAAVHGFVTLEAQGQFELDEDVDASFEHMLSALIRGFTTR